MSNTKRKLMFWVSMIVLSFVFIIALLYSYLAFMPTGYDRFEPAARNAAQNISALIHPTTSTVTAAAPALLPFPDAYERFSQYGNMVRAVQKPEEYKWKYMFFDSWTPEVHVREFNVGQASSLAGASLWSNLDELSKSTIIQRLQPSSNKLEPVNNEQVALFNGYLDRLEAYLTQPAWPVKNGQNVLLIHGSNVFECLTFFTIARASLRGDQAHALKLLDGYLGLLRLEHMLDSRGGPSLRDDGVAFLLFGLAELPDFPAEGWTRIADALERMRLSDAQLADMRRVRAEDFRESMANDLATNHFETKKNIWHFFGHGSAERIANKALLPVAMNALDRFTIALAEGNARQIEEREAAFYQLLATLMNSRGYMRGAVAFTYGVDDIGQMNAQIDRALLMLWVARLRGDGTTITTIVSNSKPGAQRFEAISMPRSGRLWFDPANPKHRADEWNRFERVFERRVWGLVSPEEWDAIETKLGPGNWRNYVIWYEPATAYLFYGPSRSAMEYVDWIHRAPPQKRQDEREDMLSLHAIVYRPPVLTAEMRKILFNRSNSGERPSSGGAKRL